MASRDAAVWLGLGLSKGPRRSLWSWNDMNEFGTRRSGQGRVRKRVERVAPKLFDIMPQRANLVANVIVRRRLCPKRYGMARLIYG